MTGSLMMYSELSPLSLSCSSATGAAAARNQWRHELFSCCDEQFLCFDVHCNCPCAIARQWDALEGRPDSMNCLICWAGLCFNLSVCLSCAVRYSMVSRFHIDESPCWTAVIGCCVPSCAACQQHRELTVRGLRPGLTCCCGPHISGALQGPEAATMTVNNV